jgi:hypothetical protein
MLVQSVRYLNGDVNTSPFKYWTSNSLVFKFLYISDVQYKDPYCTAFYKTCSFIQAKYLF